jgi:tetratricopeptide (TPR) repeat protein
MLETIRELASELLDASDETDEIRRRHAEHFLGVAETTNMRVERADHGPNRFDIARPELDNFRAALDWALEHDPQLGVLMVVELEQFFVSVDPVEGSRRLGALLERAGELPPELEAAALRVHGGTTQVAGDPTGAEQLYRASLDAYERLGDEYGIVHLRHRLHTSAAEAGDWPRARQLVEENLPRARALGSKFLEAEALGGLAGVAQYADEDFERAADLYRPFVELSRELGFNWFVAGGQGGLAECRLELGQVDHAYADACAGLALAREMDDPRLTAWMLLLLAVVAGRRGSTEHAGRLWGAADAERARGALGSLEYDFTRWMPELPLGDAGFEAGFLAGLRISLDEASAAALGQRET